MNVSQSKITYFLFATLFITGVISGCRHNKWNRLSKEQLQDVMVDVTVAQGLMYTKDMPDSTRQVIYNQIFSKHGVTQQDYDSTIAYYTARKIDVQLLVTQRVLDSLKKLQERVAENKQKHDELNRDPSSFYYRDSVNILRDSVTIYHIEKTFVNRYFRIDLNSPYYSPVRVRFTSRIHGINKMNNQAFRMYLYLDLTDSTRLVDTCAIDRNGTYNLELSIPDGKSASALGGFVRTLTPSPGNKPIKKGNNTVVIDSFSVARYTTVASDSLSR